MNPSDAFPAFQELPLGAVRPSGWLLAQLKLQADGLTGHLEEIWDDVSPNSAWLGGTGEGWERGPYYLDGLIPLTYVLQDERLLAKARKWVEAILASQREDGFFGPLKNDDWWPRMVALKCLAQHHEATSDGRVLDFMARYFRHQRDALPTRPLSDWGQARSAENALAVLWLHERTGEAWLLELVDLLSSQGLDWDTYLTRDLIREPATHFDHFTHVVNVAMALKAPAMRALRGAPFGQFEIVRDSLANLDRYHGMVNGMFSGDEWLAGLEPQHGVELCAVVEFMFSLRQLIRVFGDGAFGDRLELVAYNALAAHCGSDMRTHQYHQQVNQVLCSIAPRNWTMSSDDANTFGLEPHFGCCTANLHQGWPKFVGSLWMRSSNGLAVVAYGPNELRTAVEGTAITVHTVTDYPFNDRVELIIQPAQEIRFELLLRIPRWCIRPDVEVNGLTTEIQKTDRGFVVLDRMWKPGDRIELRLPAEVRTIERPKNAVSLALGPIVLALSPGEVWERISGSEHFGDWELRARRSWNYGLLVSPESPGPSGHIERMPVASPPFSLGKSRPHGAVDYAPLRISVLGKRVLQWRLVDASAGPVPQSPVASAMIADDLQLVPYGCTRIRIAEFPRVIP